MYKDINREVHAQDRLLQVYTDGSGHCDFTPEQLLTAVQAMERWLDTGDKPRASFFPEAQGFVHGFRPPAWWQPIHERGEHHDH